MKKILSIILASILLFGLLPVAYANSDAVTVLINGEQIEFDQPPIIDDGRILVPIRAAFEALGADVYWNEDYRMVGIIKNKIKIFALVGKKEIIKFVGETIEEFEQELTLANDEQTKIEIIESDIRPQIINGRTLVPMRVISEALGIFVDWDGNTNTAILECDEEFINQKNEDKAFINKFISFFDKQFTKPYSYTEVETSPFVPENIKELCREISGMTDAVQITKIIIDKFGNPKKNYMDSPMFIMPVWEVEGGELSLVFFQGVTFSNENGTWNLLPEYSKFYEVWRSELDISTEWGYYGGESFISAVGAGDLFLNSDGLYEFQLNESIKDISGIEDFIESAFFSKYPTGKWEIKFEKDYNWETDINTIKFNNLIAAIYFTSDGGDTAIMYIKKSTDGFEFDALDELKCNISPCGVRSPFETNSIFPFI